MEPVSQRQGFVGGGDLARCLRLPDLFQQVADLRPGLKAEAPHQLAAGNEGGEAGDARRIAGREVAFQKCPNNL